MIDLIDESVDMTILGQRDYIGSARIPLREVLLKGSITGDFNVYDENRRMTGQLSVAVEMSDSGLALDGAMQNSMRVTHSQAQQKDVIKCIAQSIARSGL